MDPVPAGASRVYEFDLPAGSAGTYWYHPHPHLNTAEQVSRGLAGPLIVRSGDDPLAHIPEITLFVTGVRLDANAEISADNAIDWTVGRQNELLLVNGGRRPIHTVRPGATQRWRILNATASRHFRLALEGHELTLVGTDGGLLAAPIGGLTEILVAPAQRVEIAVSVNPTPNARYRLQALQYETDYLGLGTYADVDLLTLATNAEASAAPLVIPGALRPIADLGVAGASQRIELSEVTGLCTRSGATVTFLINGRIFDPDRSTWSLRSAASSYGRSSTTHRWRTRSTFTAPSSSSSPGRSARSSRLPLTWRGSTPFWSRRNIRRRSRCGRCLPESVCSTAISSNTRTIA